LNRSCNCFFVSDLHGDTYRYGKLQEQIKIKKPDALFIGGDLLPSPFARFGNNGIDYRNFTQAYLFKIFETLKREMGKEYPSIWIILGNDDSRIEEASMLAGEERGLWKYCHKRRFQWHEFSIYGYSYVPPTPFRLKDWERYDVTDYIRPGCIPLESGIFSMPVPHDELKKTTIEGDLKSLTAEQDMEKAIFLFHSPPHRSILDRADLDGMRVDGIQIDVHVGSVAIQRFIDRNQPLLTLHGHIHESTRLTGSWRQVFGRTHAFNASHDGKELALVRFNPHCPTQAVRELL